MAVDERHRRAEPGPTAPPRQPTHPRRHCSHPGLPLAPLTSPTFQRPPPPPSSAIQTYSTSCRFHAATAAPTTAAADDDASSKPKPKSCPSIFPFPRNEEFENEGYSFSRSLFSSLSLLVSVLSILLPFFVRLEELSYQVPNGKKCNRFLIFETTDSE